MIPELTLHMATVNKEIETKTVELEELRTEYRDTCQKEERLRRKRDKYCGKYEEMRKRSCYCNDALTIIPKVHNTGHYFHYRVLKFLSICMLYSSH